MTKQELKEYYWIRRRIQQLEKRLLELETAATKQATSLIQVQYNDDYNKDKMAELVAEMADVQQEINKKVRESYAVLLKIEKAIETLPHREKYLMHARYIDCKSWEQIAVDMNYSWQHIHRIHARALKLLAKENK